MYTHPTKIQPTSSNNGIMSNADRIAAALADLESQTFPNCQAISNLHEVVHTTLIRQVYVLNQKVTADQQQANGLRLLID